MVSMDNMNDDGRKLAAARLTLERAEAARLGRELREHREGLALLPAFWATKAFGVLYDDQMIRDAARLDCFAHIMKDYWWFFTASVAASVIIWHRNQTMLTVLTVQASNLVSCVVLTYLASSQRTKIRDSLVKDLRVLQGILGDEVLRWPEEFTNRADLERVVEQSLISVLASTGSRQIVSRWMLTESLTEEAEKRFGFHLVEVKVALRNSRAQYRDVG